MIKDMLNKYILQSARDVQFRVGHKTIFKKNSEWVQAESSELSLSEWEDLKDLCLRPDEKIYLETKGAIKGFFSDGKNSWIFSFVEWKENLKAFFTFVSNATNVNQIQNPLYWAALNNKQGLHIISGFKQSGKSTLLKEIIKEIQKNSPQQIVLHSESTVLTQNLDETLFQLGTEAISWTSNHSFYDGIDIIILDINEILNFNKWVQFAEAGKKVFVTISSDSIENVLLQIKSQLFDQPNLFYRCINQISTILNQKIIGLEEGSVHEILVFKNHGKKELITSQSQFINIKDLETSNNYQSYNQSIIQGIVRRRFDMKTAFAASDDPEALDILLKKMGL